MTIKFRDNVDLLTPDQLKGFFVGWPDPPNTDTHLKILKNSYKIWLAFEDNRCVGFINAISDKIFYSYIPLLEVLPEYQGKGIGSELMDRMIKSLENMYAIDVVCDDNVTEFYKLKGFGQCFGMIKRNYERQNGK